MVNICAGIKSNSSYNVPVIGITTLQSWEDLGNLERARWKFAVDTMYTKDKPIDDLKKIIDRTLTEGPLDFTG